MNTKTIAKTVENFFKDTMGLDSETKYEDDKQLVTINSSVTIHRYNDAAVLIQIWAFESGTSHVEFIFDKIEDLTAAAPAINQLNSQQNMFKAYVRDDGFLVIDHHIFDVKDVDNLTSIINYTVNELVNDDMSKLIEPLIPLLV